MPAGLCGTVAIARLRDTPQTCPPTAAFSPRCISDTIRHNRGNPLSWVHVRFLRSRPPHPPTAQPGVIAWERGRPVGSSRIAEPGVRHRLGARASRPHPIHANAPRPAPGRPHPDCLNGVLRQGAPDRPEMPLVANLAIDPAGSDPVGGNRISQAEREQWRRSRLIEVGEIAEAVPGLVRAGRPRSREVVIPLHPCF